MIANTSFEPNLGLVTLGLSALHKELVQNGGFVYAISFESRSTFWKYYILNHADTGKSDCITTFGTDGGSMAFSGPEEKMLPNGEIARSFTNESPIPCKQTAVYTPTLSIRNNGTV